MEYFAANCRPALSSCVHRMDGRAKIVAALIYILVVVTTPPWSELAFVCYAGLLFWGLALARVPMGPFLRRMTLVLPFSALIALGLPFMESEKTVSLLGLTLSEQGLWLWFGAVVKSTLGVAALLLLVATTPFPFLQEGFYGLRLPEIFLDLLGLTHRLLFVLTAESARVRRAAKARGFAPRWLPQARGVGKLIGNIFLRSYRRAERIYAAMRLRGYKSHMPRAKRRPLARTEVFGLILFGGAVFLIRIFAA